MIPHIAFSAKRYSGKSEASRFLLAEYPELFCQKISFGTKVKEMSYKMCGFSETVMNDPQSKEHWRKFITKWCDEQRRMNPTIFSQPILDMVDAHKDTRRLICDDLRDPKREAPQLEERGFLLLRIECPYEVRKRQGLIDNPAVDGHWTETAMDSWPWRPNQVIYNDGTGDFYKSLQCVISTMLEEVC